MRSLVVISIVVLSSGAARAATTTRFLQAEDVTAASTCTPGFEATNAGFTGTAYANCGNNATDFLLWSGVKVQKAGTKRLRFRYANGTTSNRTAELMVNGVVVSTTLAFAPTGAWTTWTTVSADVGLVAGDNTVRLRGLVAAAGLANIDRLEVSEISETVPDWGIAVAESTMLRSPTPAALGDWGYANALRLHGIYLTYQRTGDARYLRYVKAWVDAVIGTQGNIYTSTSKTTVRTLSALDFIMPGVLLLDVYEQFPQANYRIALQTIRNRFSETTNGSGGQPTWTTAYPRTSDGGYFHAQSKVGELWLDGVFMGQSFLHRYGQKFGGADKRYADDEGTRQIILQFNHEHDATTGLFFHAFDEEGDPTWPLAPGTHHSQEFWCRAIGWYAMSTVEVLAVLDTAHPSRPQLLSILQGLIPALATYQDPVTGRWFQLVAKGSNPANWTETSCSAMFSYVTSRAVAAGYVPSSYATTASNGYNGVLDKIAFAPDATLTADLTNITDICEGTNVTDEAGYLARQRPVNDNHGIGAFLIMYEQFAPNPPPPRPPVIQNLVVNDTTVGTDAVANNSQWSAQSDFRTGVAPFGDRTYTVDSINPALARRFWIRTAADSKSYTGDPLATFTLNGTAVFLLVDKRHLGTGTRPPWLPDPAWVDQGYDVVIRQSSTATFPYRVFRKAFTSGSVVALPRVNSSTAPCYLVVTE
jgi:rhamnogalacturonyl hydrolase YesR